MLYMPTQAACSPRAKGGRRAQHEQPIARVIARFGCSSKFVAERNNSLKVVFVDAI